MTIKTLKSPNPRNRNSISVIKSTFLSVSSMNTLLAIFKVTDARHDVIRADGLYHRFPWLVSRQRCSEGFVYQTYPNTKWRSFFGRFLILRSICNANIFKNTGLLFKEFYQLETQFLHKIICRLE